jgi:hypothetical protein
MPVICGKRVCTMNTVCNCGSILECGIVMNICKSDWNVANVLNVNGSPCNWRPTPFQENRRCPFQS